MQINHFIFAISLFVCAFTREVPAKVELCRRFNMACASASAEGKITQANQTDVGGYCGKYEPHYLYYCVGGNRSGNKQDIDRFCQSFTSACKLIDSTKLAILNSGDDVKQKCQQLGATAVTLCTGNEQGHLRRICDAYRQNCVPSQGGQLLKSLGKNDGEKVSVLLPNGQTVVADRSEVVAMCNRYKPLAERGCLGNLEGQIKEMCSFYKRICVDGNDKGSPQAPTTLLKNVKDTVEIQNAEDICKTYEEYVKNTCKSTDQYAMPPICQVYKKLCKKEPPKPPAVKEAKVEQSVESVKRTSELCTQYESFAAVQCTGKEEGDLKKACQAYQLACGKTSRDNLMQQSVAQQNVAQSILPGFSTTAQRGIASAVQQRQYASLKSLFASGQLPVEPHHIIYCKKYAIPFSRLCLRPPNNEALFFCLAYGERCFPGVFKAARMSSQPSRETMFNPNYPPSYDIPLICIKYKDISERYCVGYEPAYIQNYCNLYRSLCLQ